MMKHTKKELAHTNTLLNIRSHVCIPSVRPAAVHHRDICRVCHSESLLRHNLHRAVRLMIMVMMVVNHLGQLAVRVG